MPGTYIFKPIEAKLTHDTSIIGKMDPYCIFEVNDTQIQTQVCKKGGKQPRWNETLTIPVINDSTANVFVHLRDKDRILSDDEIGSVVVNLKEIQSMGQVNRWFPLSYKGSPAGDLLMEVTYEPSTITTEKDFMMQETMKADAQKPESVFVEQKQVIEPHTFTKQVETVETRAGMKEIEVMEPRMVTKKVTVTEPVHVTKQIPVTEPEVVMKEVEVMEPQLVTKTIQVVEDVPVMRPVEVVEMKTRLEEVETVESRTMDKEVEVLEYVPVKKAVEVSEPVTVKKNVEFVEPVITTKTVTKEVPKPVVVKEDVTTTVGPASVIGMGSQKLGEKKMMKEEKMTMEKEMMEREMMGMMPEKVVIEKEMTSVMPGQMVEEMEKEIISGMKGEKEEVVQTKVVEKTGFDEGF